MSDLGTVAAGVICLGFDGKTAKELDRRLTETPFAGYVLFARNVESVEQTRALTQALSAGSDLARIVAIDQEGGRVARLRAGVEEIPSMMAVAATGDPDLAYRAGAQIGFDLRRAGVNVDFAPVADLALFERNTVIGARSFGDDPARVAEFAAAVARGLSDAGVVPTYKHFPGHGSTDVDSHLDLPVIDLSEEVLRARDLMPFRALLQGAPAVMTAHIVVKAFDDDRAATVSHRVLGELLREACGFSGVCFTDCMQMDAIAKGIGSVNGAIEALRAGADCVLVSHSLELALEIAAAIEKAVRDGVLSEDRLREAHARVTALRKQLVHAAAESAREAPPNPGIGRKVGRHAVTVIRGEARARADGCVVVSFEGTTTDGVQGTHSDHAALDANLPYVLLALEPEPHDIDVALERLRALAKRPIVVMRRAHMYASQLSAVERIVAAFPDAVVVSAREPYDAFKIPAARTLLCTYGDEAPSMQGLSDVLFGGVPATGRLPVHAG